MYGGESYIVDFFCPANRSVVEQFVEQITSTSLIVPLAAVALVLIGLAVCLICVNVCCYRNKPGPDYRLSRTARVSRAIILVLFVLACLAHILLNTLLYLEFKTLLSSTVEDAYGAIKTQIREVPVLATHLLTAIDTVTDSVRSLDRLEQDASVLKRNVTSHLKSVLNALKFSQSDYASFKQTCGVMISERDTELDAFVRSVAEKEGVVADAINYFEGVDFSGGSVSGYLGQFDDYASMLRPLKDVSAESTFSRVDPVFGYAQKAILVLMIIAQVFTGITLILLVARFFLGGFQSRWSVAGVTTWVVILLVLSTTIYTLVPLFVVLLSPECRSSRDTFISSIQCSLDRLLDYAAGQSYEGAVSVLTPKISENPDLLLEPPNPDLTILEALNMSFYDLVGGDAHIFDMLTTALNATNEIKEKSRTIFQQAVDVGVPDVINIDTICSNPNLNLQTDASIESCRELCGYFQGNLTELTQLQNSGNSLINQTDSLIDDASNQLILLQEHMQRTDNIATTSLIFKFPWISTIYTGVRRLCTTTYVLIIVYLIYGIIFTCLIYALAFLSIFWNRLYRSETYWNTGSVSPSTVCHTHT